ncbi:MAG: NADPH-dependent oxidoreductase [Alphaproteobacteria bacterium]|nr:NADPH-dependent oxidoreductase [Alphaproteobacteria bacterium]
MNEHLKPDALCDAPTSETIETLLQRVSVRDYADKPVDEETISAVLRAAFRAPTSSNIQSYSVIVVRDQETKDKLSVVTGNQKHVAKAPVFLAFCADLTRMEMAKQRNGGNLDDNNLEMGLVSSIDAALVGMSAYLAAESIGLKGLMIGAVRNDTLKTAEILGLPKRVYCVFGMCLGWPGKVPPQKPRMDRMATVHYERYGSGPAADQDGLLTLYDKDLASHYASLGKPTALDSWTAEINKKFNNDLRKTLRADLKKLGFDFT